MSILEALKGALPGDHINHGVEYRTQSPDWSLARETESGGASIQVL